MKTPTRLLTAALATGVLAFAGVTPRSAFAQDDASGDGMPGFSMPEPEPAHDYAQGPDAEGFESMAARVSYAIGVNIGTGLSDEFERMETELQGDQVAAALEQAVAGETTKLDEGQVMETLQAFQQQMMEEQAAAAERQAQENQAAEEAFLAENAQAEGVTTTDSGLQYRLDAEGDGAVATEGQTVTLNYRGKLLDGTEFDSSYDSPEPAQFPVGAVIEGFNEALLLMPVGSKGTIWIPSELAYGQSPPPGSPIQPGSTLVFDLEILGVADEAAAPSFMEEDLDRLGDGVDAVEGGVEQADTDAAE